MSGDDMIPVPLNVRLKTARADRHITRDLRSLTFRTVAPGGFASATFSLDRPLTLLPEEIAYYADVYIDDGRNGQRIWEGRLEDPGRSAGANGQVWELVAVGPMAHAEDRAAPLIYIDRGLDGWTPAQWSHKKAELSTGEAGAYDTPSLICGFPEGASTSDAGDAADYQYTPIYDAGQQLARVNCNVDGGTNSVNVDWRLVTRITPGGTGTTRDTANLSTTAGTLLGRRGTEWTTADDVPNLRIHRVNAAVTGANFQAEFWGVIVRAVLKDVNGNNITSGYTTNSVLASDVVKDLLGRFLTKYDGAGAFVQTTTYAIEQLAYPDGATPAQVLADLMELEPGYYWTTGPSNSAGKYSFAWGAWPTSVRYEADVSDGFTSPGSADGLYNEALVRWRDPKGRRRSKVRTQAVQELTDAGLTRTAIVDLDDRTGVTGTQVNQAGDQFLAEHQYPPNAGTLTIARPILDTTKGRMVQPWEILPGYLIRVRGVRPNVNSLNSTSRDGVTTFKVVSVEFDTSTATATLELDSYSVTTASELASLKKATKRRKLPPR